MYVGHVGLALALRAERAAPPLAVLVLAAQGPDWIEVALEATGRAWVNPARSPHALPWVAAGALVVAVVAGALAQRRRAPVGRWATLTALAYASHWPADYVTGIKPTWSGGPMVGLGLYGRPGLDLALEAMVAAAGWWAWRRALPSGAPRTRGRALAWALLAVLLLLQLAADVVMSNGGWLS